MVFKLSQIFLDLCLLSLDSLIVGVGEDSLHAIPVQLFSKHVMDLHMNQEVGFAKEYEEIRAASCLEEFAAQESQNPDNVERNRYPNIVACKCRIMYKYV